MSQEIHQKLDDISKAIHSVRDVMDSVFDELLTKVSKLLVQTEIQKGLNEIARTIREGSVLPVRRINYNIKKLSEDGEAYQIRWSALQKLNCPEIIFSTMAFAGLVSLPDKHFEYLVENVPNYIEAQELPDEWIARDQIRKVVAATPRRESTQLFLQSYHRLEIQLSQESTSNARKEKTSTRKRKRFEEGEHTPSTNQGLDTGEMQTGRKIDYRCSEAPIRLMPLLGDPLFDAVADSNQWKWERRIGGTTSDCMNALVPEDRSQDISITLSVGHKKGLEVIDTFQLATT
ncbi:hypothetical protein B0O99DRAFT_672318 [Bisporella sp. PMI_857]|nr:hypothetical protein B0O99DRAFT_672318 [Bisporella sp. PMI_857]